MTETLRTERLILRPLAPEDYPAWETFATSPRAEFIGGPHSIGTAWRGFASALGHHLIHGYGNFALLSKSGGPALGMAGPWHPGDWPELEIGWTIWDPKAEGQGLAFEATTAIRAWIFRTLTPPSLVSYIRPGNTRSIALAERLGAVDDTPQSPVPAGKDGIRVYRHPPPEAT